MPRELNLELPVAALETHCTLPIKGAELERPTRENQCGKPATTGVIDPEKDGMYFRCDTHKGIVRPGLTGRVVTTVLRVASE